MCYMHDVNPVTLTKQLQFKSESLRTGGGWRWGVVGETDGVSPGPEAGG